MNVTTGKRGTGMLLTVGVYGVLFLLGVVEGAIGSFQYSRVPKPVPVVALLCCAVILATCLLGAWGMRSASGAVLPGIGWLVTSFVLSMPVSNGSVIITGTRPGEWYLYGGTLSVAAAVVVSMVGVARWAGRPRGTGPSSVPRSSGAAGPSGAPGPSEAPGTQPRRAGDT
jgi:hypothetical protein